MLALINTPPPPTAPQYPKIRNSWTAKVLDNDFLERRSSTEVEVENDKQMKRNIKGHSRAQQSHSVLWIYWFMDLGPGLVSKTGMKAKGSL